MANLGLKRFDAVKTILTTFVVEGTADLLPTPVVEVEIPKQIALAAGDIYMCFEIWRIYFGEDIAENQLTDALLEAGLVTIAQGAVVYSVASLLKVGGQLAGVSQLSSILSLSQSAILGFVWMWYCEKRYHNSRSQTT